MRPALPARARLEVAGKIGKRRVELGAHAAALLGGAAATEEP